jgi:hypothetical protein
VNGAVIMIIGGIVAWFFGVDAERQSLEDIAAPLSSAKPPLVRPPPGGPRETARPRPRRTDGPSTTTNPGTPGR